MADTNPCLQELGFLQTISDTLTKIYNLISRRDLENTEYNKGDFNQWQYTRKGKSIAYNRQITLSLGGGGVDNVELTFSKPVKINRIEQYFNSANARDFTVKMYSNIDPTAYAELDSQTGNTARSRITTFGDEYKYPSASKLTINYSNFTQSDKVTIQIQVDEL